MDPVFNPPLHRQRHQFVIDFVKRNKPKKVVDLGCSECTLLKKLRFHREIELLAGVDINGAKVKKKMHALAPISTDYLQPTYDQLRVELYQGSVTQKDARLRGFDLVTCIELIEHLTPADVELFSAVLFGYMTPKAVIISTPNFEFNSLFRGVTGFRHSDHKFEWTRAEFRSWAMKVCLDHDYEVEFTGVGKASPGLQESVGFCSQIGVFHRLGLRDSCNTVLSDNEEDVCSYTLLHTINYPTLRDNNTLRRVLVSEVLYWAEKLKNRWMEEKAGRGEGASSFCQSVSEQCVEMEEMQTACGGEEMTAHVEQCGRAVSDDEEAQCDEELALTRQKLQKPSKSQRHLSIPLTVLWSWCPKVCSLSGSLTNLRHMLMDNPEIKLSQDGSAVLVHYQEDDQDKEEVDIDLDDSGYAETSQFSHIAEQEDWDADV